MQNYNYCDIFKFFVIFVLKAKPLGASYVDVNLKSVIKDDLSMSHEQGT